MASVLRLVWVGDLFQEKSNDWMDSWIEWKFFFFLDGLTDEMDFLDAIGSVYAQVHALALI